MDPFTNPFIPDAGTTPPELASRRDVLNGAYVSLRRAVEGQTAELTDQLLEMDNQLGEALDDSRREPTMEQVTYLNHPSVPPERRSRAALRRPFGQSDPIACIAARACSENTITVRKLIGAEGVGVRMVTHQKRLFNF